MCRWGTFFYWESANQFFLFAAMHHFVGNANGVKFWWLILHVPKNLLNDNNLPCFKPIPIHCNSFTGNVCDIDIHSARARELGQQSFEIKTMNACCKYSGPRDRLQHSFGKCTLSHKNKWIALAPAAWVCSRWLWKGVGEIPQPNQPIVRLLYVIMQNITATMFKNLYQHRCGYNAHQSRIVLLFWLQCHSNCYKNEVI